MYILQDFPTAETLQFEAQYRKYMLTRILQHASPAALFTGDSGSRCALASTALPAPDSARTGAGAEAILHTLAPKPTASSKCKRKVSLKRQRAHSFDSDSESDLHDSDVDALVDPDDVLPVHPPQSSEQTHEESDGELRDQYQKTGDASGPDEGPAKKQKAS